MRDRAKFIESFLDDGDIKVLNFDRSSIINALITCLSPEEACDLLDPTFEQAYPLRRAVVRKMQRDMSAEVRESHLQLFEVLLSGLGSLSAKRHASAAGTLLEVAKAMGPVQERRALEAICAAPQSTVRCRAYTYLRHADDVMPLPDCVAAAFDTHSDVEAARLLVRRGSQNAVLERFDRLVDVLIDEKFALSRLFMKVGDRDPALLERLKAINAVAYAYACAKLGIPLTDTHMVELYRETMFSQESGLVAWCCGQMGLWNALQEIAFLAEHPPESAYRRFQESHDSAEQANQAGARERSISPKRSERRSCAQR